MRRFIQLYLIFGSLFSAMPAFAFAPELDFPIYFFSSSSEQINQQQESSYPPREDPKSSEASSFAEVQELSSESSFAEEYIPEESFSSFAEEEVPEEEDGDGLSRPPRSLTPRYPSSSSSSLSSARSSLQNNSSLSIDSSSSQQSRPGILDIFRPQRSSAESASSTSSRSSLSATASATGATVSGYFSRETWGYTEPIIDPDSIAHPSTWMTSQDVLTENASLAILITLVIGITGLIMQSLYASHRKQLEMLLSRMPLQAVLTIVLYQLILFLFPTALAQSEAAAGAPSLMIIPIFTLLFFFVVGTTNSVFNNFITAEGDQLHAMFTRIFRNTKKDRRGERWLILLFLLAYGVVGAHINPDFSLAPRQQVGMAAVAVIAILLSGYAKDFLRYFLAKFWKYTSWFKANGPGLALALVCVFLSRSLDLSPGYIYGLPIGLFIVSSVYERTAGVFEFLGLLWMMILAAIVWFAAPFVSGYEVLYDFFLLSFVILAEGVFFEMIPLPYQSGGPIFQWKPLLWAVQFAVVVFLVFQTILNRTGSLTTLEQSPPALATLLFLGCYSAGVVLLWVMVVKSRKG